MEEFEVKKQGFLYISLKRIKRIDSRPFFPSIEITNLKINRFSGKIVEQSSFSAQLHSEYPRCRCVLTSLEDEE